ncbi:XRE family transcriptional regulator [Oscillospiraceae bacterium OttesenSCG-928-G22]|nr:XRE family transcriptional regulator [Oscillospiraceae bacterium OttesenSCG-928-G22]
MVRRGMATTVADTAPEAADGTGIFMKEVYDKIRRVRKEKNMTLADLSELTGLSISFLSLVERQNCDVTLTSLAKIANALDIDIRSFFQADTLDRYITRKDAGIELDTGNKKMKYYKLSGNFRQREIELLLVVIKAKSQASWESHVGEEFFYILDGEVIFKVAGETHHLAEGECIHFPSYLKHSVYNPTDRDVKMLSAINQIMS